MDMASPVFSMRLDPDRRADWVAAAGGRPLAEWVKRVCDSAAVGEGGARRENLQLVNAGIVDPKERP